MLADYNVSINDIMNLANASLDILKRSRGVTAVLDKWHIKKNNKANARLVISSYALLDFTFNAHLTNEQQNEQYGIVKRMYDQYYLFLWCNSPETLTHHKRYIDQL